MLTTEDRRLIRAIVREEITEAMVVLAKELELEWSKRRKEMEAIAARAAMFSPLIGNVKAGG